MSLKVAIVGCGQIADGHVSEIQKLDTAQVVACCDLELLMAEQLAVRFNIPAHYDDYEKMLVQEKPDVVHVATPPASHLTLATRAIDAGAHVYVEKPFALNYDNSLKLVEHAKQANKKLTVGHTYELDPPALRMREMIAQGLLGEPVHLESWFGYNLAGPFGKVILGSTNHWVHHLPGKLFHNNINHMLNKVTELVQDDRPQISAVAWRRRDKSFGDVRDELLDELRVIVRGEKVSAYGTFTSHVAPVMHYARVFGTKNTIHVDYNTRTVTLEQGPTLPSAIGRVLPGYMQAWEYFKSATHNVAAFARSEYHFFAGLNNLIRMFYASILDDAPPPIAYRDILRIAWMLDEIFRQISGEGVQ